jgi:dUTP pyrophosphatase
MHRYCCRKIFNNPAYNYSAYRSFKNLSMAAIQVRIVNHSSNPLPAYATPGSSGMDVRADLHQEIILKPLERALIPTGLFIELPQGYEAQVRPRSGLALKQGLTCLNSPGTVDADYRGELKVLLINLSNEAQHIHHGDRIAQMVIQKVELVEWLLVEDLAATQRGAGGFGHTGKQ